MYLKPEQNRGSTVRALCREEKSVRPEDSSLTRGSRCVMSKGSLGLGGRQTVKGDDTLSEKERSNLTRDRIGKKVPRRREELELHRLQKKRESFRYPRRERQALSLSLKNEKREGKGKCKGSLLKEKKKKGGGSSAEHANLKKRKGALKCLSKGKKEGVNKEKRSFYDRQKQKRGRKTAAKRSAGRQQRSPGDRPVKRKEMKRCVDSAREGGRRQVRRGGGNNAASTVAGKRDMAVGGFVKKEMRGNLSPTSESGRGGDCKLDQRGAEVESLSGGQKKEKGRFK